MIESSDPPLPRARLASDTARALARVGIVAVVAVLVFSAGFQLLKALEGADHTWFEAIYWTLVTMTTLGYGDIVFTSDLGRMYSVLVLLVGALLIFILLPFTFIQLVFLPWRAALREARTPKTLPERTTGHVILTGHRPLERMLRRRAEAAGIPTVVVLEDAQEAATLHDEGFRVLVGDLDDPATYRAAHADRAVMVLAAGSDQRNTNVAFTVREVTDAPTLVATVASRDSIDVLELAGADHVIHLSDLLGEAFAERILTPRARYSVIAHFANVLLAETAAAGTELVGRTLGELDLNERFGVSVVGVWERGSLLKADPGERVDEASVLLLSGTNAQLEAYDESFAEPVREYAHPRDREEHVVILGAGRVGRAVARTLASEEIPYRVVDREPERVREFPDAVVGDAADLDVLQRAGIDQAFAVVVTTHDDDMNVYLTLYSRGLRSEAEVLGRVAVERNVGTMHRAGADFVLSYASAGAIEAWNAIRAHPTLLLSEGLVAFRLAVPRKLVGRSLAQSEVLETRCAVVGLVRNGHCITDVDHHEPLPADADLVLVSDLEAEEEFYRSYLGPSPDMSLGARLRRKLGRGRAGRSV